MTPQRNLPEPLPLDQPVPGYSEWIRALPLRPFQVPDPSEAVDIFGLLRRRRSSREFGPLPSCGLASLLFHSVKTLEVRRRDVGPDWEHRPLPASGGCHAVQVLVIPQIAAGQPCGVYDPRAHGCRVIDNPNSQAAALEALGEMEIRGTPTLLVFFVDPARIAGYYVDWESLVWRDSGVITGGMSLVAAALDLNFCPLGFTGARVVRSLLPIEDAIGVGGCVVGT